MRECVKYTMDSSLFLFKTCEYNNNYVLWKVSVCVCVVQGDVQMSVTVLLVLGERASTLVDEPNMEHWFSSYIGIIDISVTS